MNPATELTHSLARFAERCRSARWWGALFHVGICQDIAADVCSNQEHIRQTAESAEGFDIEALAEIEAAQKPDSDGGCDITRREMRRIKPLIAKSAALDHEVGEMARR